MSSTAVVELQLLPEAAELSISGSALYKRMSQSQERSSRRTRSVSLDVVEFIWTFYQNGIIAGINTFDGMFAGQYFTSWCFFHPVPGAERPSHWSTDQWFISWWCLLHVLLKSCSIAYAGEVKPWEKSTATLVRFMPQCQWLLTTGSSTTFAVVTGTQDQYHGEIWTNASAVCYLVGVYLSNKHDSCPSMFVAAIIKLSAILHNAQYYTKSLQELKETMFWQCVTLTGVAPCSTPCNNVKGLCFVQLLSGGSQPGVLIDGCEKVDQSSDVMTSSSGRIKFQHKNTCWKQCGLSSVTISFMLHDFVVAMVTRLC